MKYTSLQKIYYVDKTKDKAAYHQAYTQRTQNEDSTYWLPVSIGQDKAFIFCCKEMLDLVQRIYYRNNKLTRLFNKTSTFALNIYVANIALEEIQESNTIEGVHSTKRELQEVLDDEQPDRYRRFEGVVRKYTSLLDEAALPLGTAADIRSLYDSLLLPDMPEQKRPDGAVFRHIGADVLNDVGKVIHQGLVPEENLIATMNASLRWLENGEPPQIIRVAAFHYLFGYMHPFYDGNGRMSRFISSYLLKDSLNLLAALSIAQQIKQHQRDYYNAFKTCNHSHNQGDLTPFVLFFLEMVLEAIDTQIARLGENLQQFWFYRDIRREKCTDLPKSQAALLDKLIEVTLFSYRPWGVRDVVEEMNCSENAARKNLAALVEKGLVTQAKDGRSFCFEAALDALEQL